MGLFHIFILALVQGITEFLPISSSGHLILVPHFTGLPDQGLAIDVAVHVGTLAAIIAYFARDVWGLARGGISLTGVVNAPADKRRFLYILVGTVPAGLVGVAFKTFGVTEFLRSAELATGISFFWSRASRASPFTYLDLIDFSDQSTMTQCGAFSSRSMTSSKSSPAGMFRSHQTDQLCPSNAFASCSAFPLSSSA